jgi:hypothetical protein
LEIQTKAGSCCLKSISSTSGNKREISIKVLPLRICKMPWMLKRRKEKNSTIKRRNRKIKGGKNLS